MDRRPKKTHQERHSCIHGAHHRSGPEAPKDDPNVDALKEVKILNLLIKSRLKALQSYKAREESLYPCFLFFFEDESLANIVHSGSILNGVQYIVNSQLLTFDQIDSSLLSVGEVIYSCNKSIDGSYF